VGSPFGSAMPPPPPPPEHKPSPPPVVRMGGLVVNARALYQPQPVYPEITKIAHIQGTVALQAVIAVDGTIKDLKVMSGHPLLIAAALEAVRAWRYQPTKLNGEPVEVLTEIDVNFRLGE
jgi:protein TonB